MNHCRTVLDLERAAVAPVTKTKGCGSTPGMAQCRRLTSAHGEQREGRRGAGSGEKRSRCSETRRVRFRVAPGVASGGDPLRADTAVLSSRVFGIALSTCARPTHGAEEPWMSFERALFASLCLPSCVCVNYPAHEAESNASRLLAARCEHVCSRMRSSS